MAGYEADKLADDIFEQLAEIGVIGRDDVTDNDRKVFSDWLESQGIVREGL